MNKEYVIKIYMVNGEKDEWRSGEWDYYDLVDENNLFFVVVNKEKQVGFYPIKNVHKIIIKKDN